MTKHDTLTPSRPSRRGFLEGSLAAVAGGALAPLALERSVHAAGSGTFKVGLVGCGGRGTGAAVNAMRADPGVRLTALADVFADRLEGSLERLKKAEPDQVAVSRDHCFVGFDACRQLIASGVDVVLLAATPHFRPMHLKACVEAGKHVFCEKPVAVDAPGVRAVVAACEEAKKKGLWIVSGLHYRYHPGIQETMKRVHDGAIGRVVSVQVTYNCGPPWFRNKPRQPEWTEMEYQIRNWYPFTWLSGDHNVEQHVHSLDKASWALGDQPPQRAWGMGGRQVRSEITLGQIYDHHAVVYEYADGTPVHSYCRRQANCYNEISDRIVGTKGTCDVMKHRIEGETTWQYEGPKCNAHQREHDVMYAALREGRPINNGAYMARSTMLAVLGRMVTYSGRRLGWDEALASNRSLAPEAYRWDADPPVLPDENGEYPIAVPGVAEVL